jgi:competence protein ComEC
MDSARAEILGPAPWNFLGVLSRLSQSLSARLQVLLPEPEASFAVGLLLGKRQNMDQDLQDAFQAVGLTHIVAISGSNIALVVILFFTLFSFLPFHRRLAFSAIGVVTFVLLVGPSAAVVRAGLMGVLSLVGLYSGRKSQAYFGLLWSAVLMVLWNPLVLTYDVGFQLSFASTFGILTLTPILEKVFPQRLWMRDELILTLAAQLMTLPFIIFYFGRISWITPLANLVVAPLIPLAMGSSALALLFGTPAAALAWTFLMLIEKVALLCAAIPGVQWELTVSPSLFIFCLVFSALSLLSFYKSKWARAFLRECEGLPSKALNSPFEKHETR